MQTVFKGKKITGLLGILPENEYFFDDEINNYSFPVKQSLRLKRVMGFNKHRLAKPTSRASDFCICGLNYMFENNLIKKDEVGAIIAVTLSPDYFLPQISNIIQGKCSLPADVICLDIAQGCCGFLIGLMQAAMLLEHIPDKKALIFNTDILSHKVSKQDRNDFPLIGDATTITVVENNELSSDIYYTMYMDGEKRNALIIPAGGYKMPSTQKTGEMYDMGDGNFRSLDNLHMDGSAIFNFIQTKVPSLIEENLKFSNISKEKIDYFLFHQPNKFMLKKLGEKLEISEEKLFMNLVENYGNPSGASIPLVALYNLSEKLIVNKYKCCLSAFGSGLAWGSAIMDIGNLKFCKIIESDY